MKTRFLLPVLVVFLLSPQLSYAKDELSTKQKVPTAVSKKKSGLVTIRGKLQMSFIASNPLGNEMSPSSLRIEHEGKTYDIKITEKTKLDSNLSNGQVSLGGTYKVTGRIRGDSIEATEMSEITEK